MEDFTLIKKKLLSTIDFDFFDRAVLSRPLKRGEGICFKAVVSKTAVKGGEGFQISYFIDKKVIHENIIIDDDCKKDAFDRLADKILSIMSENFKQCNLSADKFITLLMNKKRMFRITGLKENDRKLKTAALHNEQKNYIIKEGVYADWLFETGIMDKNGKVHNSMQKKFRQINRFTEMIADVERFIPENGVILDMGCGKSYLTFAVYYYFNVIKKKNVIIKGFDLKKDVVDNCNAIAGKSGFSRLQFFAGDIAGVDVSERVDMIITLHACDTATDIAIAYGINRKCRVIMCVPCCQHELFGQVKNNTLDNILSYGILKERFSALLTDGLRAEALKLSGYKTSVLEFIDMEHTPKNIMIRAVKKENFIKSEKDIENYERLLKEFNVSPMIWRLLKTNEKQPNLQQ